MQHPSSDLHTYWQTIHQQLTRKQQEIIAEIRSYPPPIPACDAQYNYLLEQRTAIRQELRQVEALQQQLLTDTDPQMTLHEFLQDSQFMKLA